MNVSQWDNLTKTSRKHAQIMSYAITGQKETWEMYLHGPHIQLSERTFQDAMPPVYIFATFTNQVYRFENFSAPSVVGGVQQPLQATQKVVGHALAPSTGYVIEHPDSKKVTGMLIAEGQPFLMSNIDTMPPHELYLGGVEYLQNDGGSAKGNCTQIFPTRGLHAMLGEVVNTIDCHQQLGVCFFTVWKFYDDQAPIWNPLIQAVANDCLYYCMLEDDWQTGKPTCRKSAVVTDEHGEKICHKKGVGAVHGMTIGNTDPDDPRSFDIFLVFTGKAEMSNGESSMKKVSVQVWNDKAGTDLRVLKSQPFGSDLFGPGSYAPKGWDVGGDHAWVDETGKYIWVSCFREKGVGAHMLDYETGALIYSVTGLDKYVPNQYTYTAGIHGVGTLGKKGSYLAIATSSCHDISICIPTVPWHKPVPEKWWSTAPMFLVDLASMKLDAPSPSVDIVV